MDLDPTIRTSQRARAIAKLTRELAGKQQFATWADLFDAVKSRASRLRVRYTPDEMRDGVRMVASNVQLLTASWPRTTSTPTEISPVARRDATAVLENLSRHMGGASPKSFPPQTFSQIDIYGPVPRTDDFGDHDRY